MKDIVGQKFGRWLVLSREPEKRVRKCVAYLCRCDCGTEKLMAGSEIKNGVIRSCGCLTREATSRRSITHGGSKRNPRLFNIWLGMVRRCTNPSDAAYRNYGGRGIAVCERWMDVNAFIDDNEDLARPHLTLDRRNNDGPYSPDNCRWATRKEQGENRRTTMLVTYKREQKPLADWAVQFGIPKATLRYRLQNGWSMARAIQVPVRQMLEPETVKKIRHEYDNSARTAQARQALAGKYSISRYALRAILYHQNWNHL